jgi:Tol biopolymer transport system component
MQQWLKAQDGSDARTITHHGSFEQPFWSPDGLSIAVSAPIAETHRRIYGMRAYGLDVRPIRQRSRVDNIHPAWSSDGRSIGFP